MIDAIRKDASVLSKALSGFESCPREQRGNPKEAREQLQHSRFGRVGTTTSIVWWTTPEEAGARVGLSRTAGAKLYQTSLESTRLQRQPPRHARSPMPRARKASTTGIRLALRVTRKARKKVVPFRGPADLQLQRPMTEASMR